ncbi:MULTISPECIES: nitrous oxide-stimulated promoter family protein [unclassified Shewanella]|uniref:nitrous oxide-stimulated promoter family protein n=1 Tax=unclassified Shewanella TaxID=196818 RepID=UPI000C8190C8|nr:MULTISPECIES: nitrous oxide-stimulated promoter family protein [unclassified Shewanella]MDO6620084.1 nitrous oxide-stimulated promoter family protein [Shewanella sp. 6_MG-2023]MDO6640166.1 nitrous oxide-stimulated promoter family protein [Shewanella sp. 5_MG-2023]MDO6679300.1 nitrous oxide-stimulated promoter family protein [Shewanella sp. 4_MG-2023]MDO6776766.1 nitrous oxide-stimulated promoter family protein [Shewanella sp. 3_MG-2023]PMG30978.1 nitrous oxide-stimulated promoter [Shewanell
MTISAILSGKLLYEFNTMNAMAKIYCRAHHQIALQTENSQGLCPDCIELLEYAETRLDRCPYGQQKPTCNKCPVHCYKPHMKQKVREIMIYSGPRMLLPHPIMAITHLLAERKPAPGKPPEAASNRHMRKQKKHNNAA